MRRTAAYLSAPLIAGCLCGGCLPLRFNSSPGATGTVLDSQTHSAITNAQVAVSFCKYPPPSWDEALAVERPPKVNTDASGRFAVPPERRWGIYIWPVDAFPEFGLLTVRRDGYEVAGIPIWSRSVTNLGPILLKPLKPGARNAVPAENEPTPVKPVPPGAESATPPGEPK